MELPLVSATFEVEHWFRGGEGTATTVDIADPSASGASDGADPDDLLAWSCGFTRSYDAATAAQWQAAMG
ncbi:MAG: hypothetical protein ABIS35_13075 [Terracoccus sp.]